MCSPKPGRARRAWLRWVRMPSFAQAYVVSLITLIGWWLWILLDSQFGRLLELIRIDIGLQPVVAEPGFEHSARQIIHYMHGWNYFGWRLALFTVWCTICAASFIVLVWHMLLGRGRGRTVAGWLLTTGLIAGWLALLTSYDATEWFGVQQRIRRKLPRFKAVAQQLLTSWPTEHGSLPEAGRYVVDPVKRPGTVYFLDSDPFSTAEGIDVLVARTKAGGLRFSLTGSLHANLEYHPPGSYPASHVDTWGRACQVQDTVALEDRWYLVRYESN